MTEPRDPEDEFSDDARAAETALRALVLGGFMPTLIVGERYGQHCRPPALKIGKQSPSRADKACTIADDALREMGYRVDLSYDWDRYRIDSDYDFDDDAPQYYELRLSIED